MANLIPQNIRNLVIKLNNPTLILSLLIVLGVLLRLCSLWFEPNVARDSVEYSYLIAEWHSSNDFSSVARLWHKLSSSPESTLRLSPLYLFLSSRLMVFGLSAMASAIMVSMISGTLMIYSCYKIYKLLIPNCNFVVWGGTLLVAIHPSLVYISVTAIRDSLALSAFALALYFSLYAIIKSKSLFFFFAGLAITISFMTRTEYLESIIIAVVYLLYNLIRYRNLKSIYNILFFAFGTLLAMVLLNFWMGTMATFFHILYEGYLKILLRLI